MKTVQIREESHKTVVRVLPTTRKKTVRPKMPDIGARLRKIFGRKVISDMAMTEILSDSRGSINGKLLVF